jgi:hypothetical protein
MPTIEATGRNAWDDGDAGDGGGGGGGKAYGRARGVGDAGTPRGSGSAGSVGSSKTPASAPLSPSASSSSSPPATSPAASTPHFNVRALPVYGVRQTFLRLFKRHQVLVLSGDTGSGKSTQLPKFLHEEGLIPRGQ